jgi:XTP/dITP diphosphohydrolase
MKILLATGNKHKAREITQILGGPGLDFLTLEDFPGLPEVVEDGATIEANARKKAVETARATGQWCLADDTGLEVEALGGAPGVHAARYAGPGCRFADNIAKLLRELSGVEGPRRRAAFRCVMVLASPTEKIWTAEGRLDGVITEAPAGEGGFGYDPVFLVPELGRTLAELSAEEKNRISHRGRALQAMSGLLKEAAA